MKRLFLLIPLLITTKINAQTTFVQEDEYKTYDGDNMVIQLTKTQSNGDVITTYYQYPKGLIAMFPAFCSSSFTGDAIGVANLVNKNIISMPIETYTAITKSSGTVYVTGGELYTFYPTLPYPKELFKLETEVPMTAFHPYVNSSCLLARDLNYVSQEKYTAYDNYGNLLEKEVRQHKKISFIYGYKGSYRIAVAENAANAQIAYSSFESEQKGFWNYDIGGVTPTATPIAGGKCYNLSISAIYRDALPVGNYIISFWKYDAAGATVSAFTAAGGVAPLSYITGPTVNGWTYYEYTASSSVKAVISGSAYIDELRLYPTSAQMETVAYKPLVGMSYSCDVANHLNYYSYDDLGRLLSIKDQDGKIIKQMEYGIQKPE